MSGPNTAPIFVLSPKVTPGTSTTGDASLTAPTHAVPVSQVAGANGGVVNTLNIAALALTTATMLRYFLNDGSAFHFYFDVVVPATPAPSGTVQAWTKNFDQNNLPTRFPCFLPPGWSLQQVVVDTQTGIEGIGRGGDY